MKSIHGPRAITPADQALYRQICSDLRGYESELKVEIESVAAQAVRPLQSVPDETDTARLVIELSAAQLDAIDAYLDTGKPMFWEQIDQLDRLIETIWTSRQYAGG